MRDAYTNTYVLVHIPYAEPLSPGVSRLCAATPRYPTMPPHVCQGIKRGRKKKRFRSGLAKFSFVFSFFALHFYLFMFDPLQATVGRIQVRVCEFAGRIGPDGLVEKDWWRRIEEEHEEYK